MKDNNNCEKPAMPDASRGQCPVDCRQEPLGVLGLLTKIVSLIFDTDNPLGHAYEIVRQTAVSRGADISTLFLVEEGIRLALKGGVAYLRGEEIRLPSQQSYELDWNASCEQQLEKKGLTAYVAVSGSPLAVNSLKELQTHLAHTGKWDDIIYPKGFADEDTGFGCLYAVPLRRSLQGDPRSSVMGVFKIERRRSRPPFSEEDCKVFDLVAAHLSLILQAYHRVQNRVFSDVAHAIGGGLGRSHLALDLCATVLNDPTISADKKLAYVSRHLPGAVLMFEKAVQRLNVVLDTSRDPNQMTDVPVSKFLESIIAEVELKAQISLRGDSSPLRLNLSPPISQDSVLRLRSLEYHDLVSIIGNLLDNAIRYSREHGPTQLVIEKGTSDAGNTLRFGVSDHGKGIPQEVLRAAQQARYSDTYRLSPGVRGTGLPRVFGLANCNKWEVSYMTDSGTTIRVTTPDYLGIPSKEGKNNEPETI